MGRIDRLSSYGPNPSGQNGVAVSLTPEEEARKQIDEMLARSPTFRWLPCVGTLRTRSFLLRPVLCYGLLAVSAVVRPSWLPGAMGP